MSDNPLYIELDRLRAQLVSLQRINEELERQLVSSWQVRDKQDKELAASERVAARLEEQRAEAEERVRELEAEMVAMRQALDDIMTNANGKWMWPSNHARKALLATDAGKAMLERMAKLEAKVAAIDALMAESTGVVGYHLNGEIATWEWLIDNWDVLTIEEAQDTTNKCPKCGKALMGKPLGCVIHGLVDPIEEAPDV